MYGTQRPLTDDEKAELAELTVAVNAVLQKRRDWLDAKMHEISRLQPGDDIYDLESGRRVGRVVELYRYQDGRNDMLDTSPYCSYRYETSPHCFDNTSRQSGRSFGTREQALEQAEMRATRLRF